MGAGGLSVVNQTVRTVLGIRTEPMEEDSDDEFGPKLPPIMTEKSIIISSDSEKEDEKWTERGKKKKNKVKDKKKHKDKKKYKEKKENILHPTLQTREKEEKSVKTSRNTRGGGDTHL